MDLIVLMGSPCSGKTSIGKEIEKLIPYAVFVSMGDFMRNELNLVPPFIDIDHFSVLEHIFFKIKSKSTPLVFILDANPYPLRTAEGISFLEKQSKKVLFVEIQCDQLKIIKRLSIRSRSDTDKNFTDNDRVNYFNVNVLPEIKKIDNRFIFENHTDDYGQISIIAKEIIKIYESR